MTESEVLIVTRAYLLSITPTPFEVIKGQVNRVPMPRSENYCVQYMQDKERLSTTIETVDPDAEQATYRAPVKSRIQMDFYGPQAVNYAGRFMTLWRSSHAADRLRNRPLHVELMPFIGSNQGVVQFAGSNLGDVDFEALTREGTGVAPLYCDRPFQLPYKSAENQWVDRWVVNAYCQFDETVSTSQEFAANLATNIISVDAEYPPGAQ